jgi:hypothetical protein
VSGGFLDSFRCASPHETSTFVIDHRVNVENFIFQVFEVVVIEVEASFESTIGHSSLPFQECDDLVEDVVECHGRLPLGWRLLSDTA